MLFCNDDGVIMLSYSLDNFIMIIVSWKSYIMLSNIFACNFALFFYEKNNIYIVHHIRSQNYRAASI
jgi:hypothetical protein